MFKNYIVIALRILLRWKIASLISIIGLALGMACALLIFLFVQFELTIDRFHGNYDRIYRVLGHGTRLTHDGEEVDRAITVFELAPKLKSEFSKIRQVVRLSPQHATLKYEGRLLETDRFYFSDPEFFDMFDFALIRGNSSTALTNPNSLVLTTEMTEALFGATDPMGRVVQLKLPFGDLMPLTVTGVLAPIPDNSSIRIGCLAHKPFESIKALLPNFMPLYAFTFVTLYNTADASDVSEHLKLLKVRDFYADAIFSKLHFALEAFKDVYFSQALYGISSGGGEALIRNGNRMLIWLLATIGLLMVGISCINIMNLSTARSANRAKEIGVRKVIGAMRTQMVTQFLIEAVVLSLIALLLAVALTEVFLPYFNTIVHRELTIAYSRNWGYLSAMVLLAVLVGIVSGIYPAFFLSSFSPTTTLKGQNMPSAVGLRKGLMVVQFVVAIMILIFSFLVTREVRFLRDKSLGFQSEHVLVTVINDVELEKKYAGLKESLLELPGVAYVSASAHASWERGIIGWSTFTCIGTDVTLQQSLMLVDPDFLRVHQIPIIEGEDFPANADKAESMCVINRTAKKEMGLDTIVGKKLHHGGFYSRQVVGVAEDFHFNFPTEKIRPLVMVPVPEYWGFRRRFVSIKLKPGDIDGTVALIEKKVKKVFPNMVFDYFWLNRDIERIFAQKNDPWEISLKFFTGFSIFIACLGLFGFAEYETARLTKEIGIRKAVGATRSQIAWHVIKSFLKLAIVANILAWPLVFLAVRYILRAVDYPYPFQMGVWIFFGTGMVTLLLTVLTISLQTFRAASVDPVEALRDE